MARIERFGLSKSRFATYCPCEGNCQIVRACLPALLITALICAFAGAAVKHALAQSETEAAAERPMPSEQRLDPGLAPPLVCMGGRVSACCDFPELAYDPRCHAWLEAYGRWRKAYDAYYRG